MPKLTGQLPEQCIVAVSGGLDSVVALDFLKKRTIGIAHVHHGTGEFADEAQRLVEQLAEQYNVELYVDTVPECTPATEEAWRNHRLEFFGKLRDTFGVPVVAAHHLDDCVEEYIVCTMKRGFMDTIPYTNGIVIRPFLQWPKSYIEKYARDRDLKWIDDPSNADTRYQRNFVRHQLRPEIEKINPGLHKLVARLIEERDSNASNQ